MTKITLENLYERRKKYGESFGALDYIISREEKKSFLLPSNSYFKNETPKHKKYIEATKVSRNISSVKSGEEFDHLLKMAAIARSIQMTEKFITLTRKLTENYDKISDKNLYRQLLKSAYLISKDIGILHEAYKKKPSILRQISLPESIKNELPKNIKMCLNKNETLDEKIYDNQEDKSWINENQEQPLTSIQRKCLKINAASNEREYTGSLNSLLDYYNLTNIEKIEEQKFESIKFKKKYYCKDHGLTSIVVSCFNSEQTIEYAIESLLNQSYKNIEILICDDQSSDKTKEIVKKLSLKDGRVRVFSSKSNQGTYNIRNSLIPLCKGEYITFHDSDDIALPERIEKQVDHLIKNNLLVSSAKWIRFKPNGKTVFFMDGKTVRFCVVSSMIKRSALSKIPRFRNSLIAADTEFYESCLYLLGAEQVGVLDIPLIFGLWGENSLTMAKGLQAKNDGFISVKRRKYSEISAKQRVLGSELISDLDIENQLKELGILKTHSGVDDV